VKLFNYCHNAKCRANYDSPLYVIVLIPPLFCPSRLWKSPQKFVSERLKTKSFFTSKIQVCTETELQVFIFSYFFSINNERYVFRVTSHHTKILLKITILWLSYPSSCRPQCNNGFFFFYSWPLAMGPIGCPETSVRNFHYSLQNNPEECSPQRLVLIWSVCVGVCMYMCVCARARVIERDRMDMSLRVASTCYRQKKKKKTEENEQSIRSIFGCIYRILYRVYHNERPNFKTLYFCNHEPQKNETCTTWTAVA
jgi:hypothetical protein